MLAKIALAAVLALAVTYTGPVSAAPGTQDVLFAKHDCVQGYDTSGPPTAPYCK